MILSSLVARAFGNPLSRLEGLINIFMRAEQPEKSFKKEKHSILEFKKLEEFLLRAFSILDEKTKAEKELVSVAIQVAHDIRSPLAALQTTVKQTKGIEEGPRTIVRHASNRINDIANNLLAKYRNTKVKMQTDIAPELVVSVLDNLLSEKRAQFIDRNIKFDFKVANDAYGLFAGVNLKSFQRVLSNVINNGVEAIFEAGEIVVNLSKDNNKVKIEIIDNGNGIPQEIIDEIGNPGVSVGKEEGSGLGLSYAVQQIKSYGGTYDIQSKLGVGTTFIIELPIVAAPLWFQQEITLTPGVNVVILDDDQSIHDVLETRFRNLASLIHCYTPDELKTYKTGNNLYLIDYELIGFETTGIDIIKKLNLTNAILITSRYEEQSVRNACIKMGIKIIPKSFAPHIAIELLQGQPELIFIDDDKLLTSMWQTQAKLNNKEIVVFNEIDALRKAIVNYNKNIPIYIDSNLEQDIKGEELAKELFDQGYTNLYLATGYTKDDFSNILGVKEIVSKEPPF